jgi:hypothetical protein
MLNYSKGCKNQEEVLKYLNFSKPISVILYKKRKAQEKSYKNKQMIRNLLF